MSYYQHHVFFCLNQRDNGDACCAAQGAQALIASFENDDNEGAE